MDDRIGKGEWAGMAEGLKGQWANGAMGRCPLGEEKPGAPFPLPVRGKGRKGVTLRYCYRTGTCISPKPAPSLRTPSARLHGRNMSCTP